MRKVYRDEDADLKVLEGRTVAVIGYGNQGRAQALNLRDSGVSVVVGNIDDDYKRQAQQDGFEVLTIEEATAAGDTLLFLIPDEVQRQVYEQSIAAHLTMGKTLTFAHGYNIAYGFIQPPKDVDVIMVAPRMIGVMVRQLFEQGWGASAYVAVHQDASGQAWQTALALCKAIGCTRAGAIETTFAEETEIDHFLEQAVWPALLRIFVLGFEVMVEHGYLPELVALEMWGSGEASEIFHAMAERGFFKQMMLHSATSQYGTLSRGPRLIPDSMKETMKNILSEIRSGKFACEWERERELGYPVFNRLRQAALSHPLNAAEEQMKQWLKGRD